MEDRPLTTRQVAMLRVLLEGGRLFKYGVDGKYPCAGYEQHHAWAERPHLGTLHILADRKLIVRTSDEPDSQHRFEFVLTDQGRTIILGLAQPAAS